MKTHGLNLWEIESLLFPPICIICSNPGVEICLSCRPAFRPTLAKIERDFPYLLSGYEYNRITGKILLQAKESNSRIARFMLAQTFSILLSLADQLLVRERYRLITVPSSPTTIRRRGYLHLDEALRISKQISPLHLSIDSPLRSARGVLDQSTLSIRERGENLQGRFTVHGSRRRGGGEMGIILIDDVVSSGSSMRESLRALKMVNIEPNLLISACLGHQLPSNRMFQ